jgi:hypothetical protein
MLKITVIGTHLQSVIGPIPGITVTIVSVRWRIYLMFYGSLTTIKTPVFYDTIFTTLHFNAVIRNAAPF